MKNKPYFVCVIMIMTGTAHGDITGTVGEPGIRVDAYKFNESGGFFEYLDGADSQSLGSYTISAAATAGNNIMVVANGASQAGRGVVLTPWDKNAQFYNTSSNYGVVTYKQPPPPANPNPFTLVSWDSKNIDIDLTNTKSTCSVTGKVTINSEDYTKFNSDANDAKPSPVINANAKIEVSYTLRNPTSTDIEVNPNPVLYLSIAGSQSTRLPAAGDPPSIKIPAGKTLADTRVIQMQKGLWNALSASADSGAWVMNAGIQFVYSGKPVGAPPAGMPACETLLFPVKKPL